MINLRRASFPMIPGILNDREVEDAKRNLREQLERQQWDRKGEGVPLVAGGESVPVLTRMPESLSTDTALPPTQVLTRPLQPEPFIPTPPPLLDTPEYAGLKAYDPATVPLIRYNNKARPIGVEGGDVLTRENALLDAQRGYKAPVSKKQIALQALLGFLNGGVPGAVGSVANYGLNQDYRNQVTMGGDIANTQGVIQRETLKRNQTNDWLNDASQRRHRDAQAQELLTREPKQDMGWIPDPNNPNADVYTPLKPGLTRKKPERDHNPLIVEVKNPDGSTSRKQSDDYGKTWRDVEGLGDAPPIQKPDGSEFTNEQIQQNIQEASTERDKIWRSLKDVPPTIMMPGKYEGDPPSVQPNPAYKDLMDRGRKLDDDIRDWKLKIKSPPVLTRGGKKWSASRWAAANPTGDLEAAKKAARAKNFQVVE